MITTVCAGRDASLPAQLVSFPYFPSGYSVISAPVQPEGTGIRQSMPFPRTSPAVGADIRRVMSTVPSSARRTTGSSRVSLPRRQRSIKSSFCSAKKSALPKASAGALRVENDLSYTDIAAVLGVREGTVKSRLARARDQLRKKLSQSGNKAAAASSNPQKGGRGHEL